MSERIISAVRRPEHRIALLGNAALPEASRVRLLTDAIAADPVDVGGLARFAAAGPVSVEAAAVLVDYVSDDDSICDAELAPLARAVASLPCLTLEQAMRLYETGTAEVLAVLGANRNVAAPIRALTISWDQSDAQEALSTVLDDLTDTLSADTVAPFALSSSLVLRVLAAGRGEMADDTMLALATGDVVPVAVSLARSRRHLPASVATALARHRFGSVRAALAVRGDLPVIVQLALAADESDIAATIANNENIAPATIDALRRHPDAEVRAASLRRHEWDDEMLAGNHASIIEVAAMCTHPHAPLALLEQCAEHDSDDVRAAVAGHERTPPAVLDRLAGDSAHVVVAAVVANSTIMEIASLADVAVSGEGRSELRL